MQFHGFTIEPRIRVGKFATRNVLGYDRDNAYPQRMEVIISASGRAISCTEGYERFLRGEGWADPAIGSMIVNRQRETLNDILEKVCADVSKYRKSFSLHLNFDILGRLVEIMAVPFKNCRLAVDDEKDRQLTGKIAYYTDWGREEKNKIEEEKIKWIDSYNPDPAKIQAQIATAKGLDNYNGQILYKTAQPGKYPLCVSDAVRYDMLSDAAAQMFRLNNIDTNFLASHFVITGKMTPEEREDFLTQLANHQGAKNAAKLFHIEKTHPEQIFDVKATDIQKIDDLFKYTDEAVNESIRKVFGILPVLIGDLVAGKLGTGQEITDATNFYNKYTRNDRQMISRIFSELMSHWVTPVTSTNWQIKELS